MTSNLIYNFIESIELELSCICNLKCVLCQSQIAKQLYKKRIRPLSEIIQQLDLFKKIKNVILCGQATEPTLYTQLFDLIEYLHLRKIRIIIYTNGSTHNEIWWEELAKRLNNNDLCIFTVAGTTQYLHSKYRVGSNLNYVISNIRSYESICSNYQLNYLQFEYNKYENEKVIDFLKNFSNYGIMKSYDVNHQMSIDLKKIKDAKKEGICLDTKDQFLYDFYMNFFKKKKNKYNCSFIKNKYIEIDNFGNIFPCKRLRIERFRYSDKLFSRLKNNIFYEQCIECSYNIEQIIKKYNLEKFNGIHEDN